GTRLGVKEPKSRVVSARRRRLSIRLAAFCLFRHTSTMGTERGFVVMSGLPSVDAATDLIAFADQTSDLIGVVDEESRFVYLNHAARKHLGVGDWSGLTTADVFPPQTFAQYYGEIRPALLRDGAWDGELALISGSGETQWMAMSLVARVGP